ncbi:MAG: DUF6077 domain-containing protein [Erysipelotrichaceae bacterium]
MIVLLLMLALTLLVSFGIGIEVFTRLQIEKNTFSMPVGFVSFIALLQVFYYPVQFFNLSFNYIIFFSILVYGLGFVLMIKNIKLIIQEIFSWSTLYIGLAFLVFFFCFYHMFIDIEFSDSQMYINYIAQNVNIDQLNMFNLYTGETGYEWEGIYLFQGYYHFGSFLCYVVTSLSSLSNITIITYGLGILYSLVSSCFLVSMLNALEIKNKLVYHSLMIFTLLYSNFYYWRVAFSYYGNTYRTLIITMLIFYIYQWFKYDNKSYKYLLIILLAGGIATSSSFLFISFATLICLTIYLFYYKKENAFIDMSLIVIPILVYAIALFIKEGGLLGYLLAFAATVYYLGIIFKFINPLVKMIETFIFNHAKLIFFVITPIFLVLFSLYINLYRPDYLYNYAYWFKDYQEFDMIIDYRFIYSNPIVFMMNIIRWLGVILLLISKEEKYQWFKMIAVVILVLFANPLVTTSIAYFIASNVFYRIIEVLFNPFTEAILILIILEKFSYHKMAVYGMSLILLFVTGINHYFGFTSNSWGTYTFYIEGGKDTMPLYKINWYEYDVIQQFDEVATDQNADDKLVVLSHTDALRSFRPDVQQIFTARDYFYFYSRIDENFYRIARDRYEWEEYPDGPYEDACMYIQRYDTDYIIIRHHANQDYDTYSDMCSETIYENDQYKLKKVSYEINFEK